jgi:hypothetical protein
LETLGDAFSFYTAKVLDSPTSFFIFIYYHSSRFFPPMCVTLHVIGGPLSYIWQQNEEGEFGGDSSLCHEKNSNNRSLNFFAL